MKLIFYSGGFPQENKKLDNKLIEFIDKEDIKLTFIPSSYIGSSEEYLEIIDQYASYGIKKILKLNIDQPFSQTLKRMAFESDIIHLGGGNTYYFLKHLKKIGLFKDLKDFVSRGGILTGLSAGAIIMTNSIDTAGFPSFDKDDNDESIKNLKGLNLVNFEFFPHYKNSKRYDTELIHYSKQSVYPIYACPDGSGITVNHDEISFIGKTICFHRGHKYYLMK